MFCHDLKLRCFVIVELKTEKSQPQIFGSFWTNRNCTLCGVTVTSGLIVDETGDGCPRRAVARAGERSTCELRGDILRIFDWAVSRSD